LGHKSPPGFGFSVNSVYYVGGYVRGFPIKSSVSDVVDATVYQTAFRINQ
jgi:hypothetical protein